MWKIEVRLSIAFFMEPNKYAQQQPLIRSTMKQRYCSSSLLKLVRPVHDCRNVTRKLKPQKVALESIISLNQKRSRNSRGTGGNKWLYPDLVGMEDLSSDWHREIKDCVQQYADKKNKLWSFEVKILINRSNVREVFFQAVSNSSWANFGYLVASQIQGADTLKELRMLASLHGIGFIRLNADDPSESQIMIPAKERTEIDWDTANRLTEENKDFLQYIKLIRQFYQTGEIRRSDWDMNTEQN